VVCRKLTISRKLEDFLIIGVSAPGIEPDTSDSDGNTYLDSSSYCMWSNGDVYAAGRGIMSGADLPASSIIQPHLFEKRGYYDKVFPAGDEVVVTLDCSAHTLRLQSPTVDYTIIIRQQHHNRQQQWVLNVNFWGGDNEVKLS